MSPLLIVLFLQTRAKEHASLKNHPVEKTENHLNQTSIFWFKPFIFPGFSGVSKNYHQLCGTSPCFLHSDFTSEK